MQLVMFMYTGYTRCMHASTYVCMYEYSTYYIHHSFFFATRGCNCHAVKKRGSFPTRYSSGWLLSPLSLFLPQVSLPPSHLSAGKITKDSLTLFEYD